MNTLGWVLILVALLLMRPVYKGRVMNLGEDLSDGFLALVRGDTADLTEVLARTGEGATPAVGATGSLIGGVAANAAEAVVGKYNLGPVKPHVKLAAESLGPRFGIKTVYGYSAVGSVRNSDHPKGLALDFMVNAKTEDGLRRGNSLAGIALNERDKWGITYIIWNKRINNGSGWQPYNGPRDHTDHVHISFKAK